MALVLAHRVRHLEMCGLPVTGTVQYGTVRCGACMLLKSVVVKAASQMMALGWKAACLQ
jgi:hypothetical protein